MLKKLRILTLYKNTFRDRDKINHHNTINLLINGSSPIKATTM